MIEIKQRCTGAVLYTHDKASGMTMRHALEAAAKSGADLRGAYLRGADLREADLRGAYLRGADLSEADLSVADLSGADLRGADLRGADLLGEKIKICPISIFGLTWDVLITDAWMTIGCERHTHADWARFDDARIRDMESRAAGFWAANKEFLLAACAAHAARVAAAD